MGMFIFVHLTPASCNWLCYGCHSNALSVALAAVILHSSAWLSSKNQQKKKKKESVCCLHLLVLRDNWPCHGGQAASIPSPVPLHTHTPLFYSKCIAKTAGQSSLTVSKCTWGVSIHHTLYIVSVLIWHKPVLPMSAWRFFFFFRPRHWACVFSSVHLFFSPHSAGP